MYAQRRLSIGGGGGAARSIMKSDRFDGTAAFKQEDFEKKFSSLLAVAVFLWRMHVFVRACLCVSLLVGGVLGKVSHD